MRTIAVEEHCLTPEHRELLGSQIHPYEVRETIAHTNAERLLGI